MIILATSDAFNPFPAGELALPVLAPPENGHRESLSKSETLDCVFFPHGDAQGSYGTQAGCRSTSGA